jgi:hypothetical protein
MNEIIDEKLLFIGVMAALSTVFVFADMYGTGL